MATTAQLRVDIERLKADVLALGEIGRDPDDRGIYRMAFTEADMRGRHWLMDRAAAAGLPASMDGAGNVHARLGPADRAARCHSKGRLLQPSQGPARDGPHPGEGRCLWPALRSACWRPRS